MAILACTCPDSKSQAAADQSRMYGPGKRVMNELPKGKGSDSGKLYRCTVCLSQRGG